MFTNCVHWLLPWLTLSTPRLESRARVLERLRAAHAKLERRADHVSTRADAAEVELRALYARRNVRALRRDMAERLRTRLQQRLTHVAESCKLQRIAQTLWSQITLLESSASLEAALEAYRSGVGASTLQAALLAELDVDALIESYAESQDVVNEVAEALAGQNELAVMEHADIDRHLRDLCAEQGIDLDAEMSARGGGDLDPALTHVPPALGMDVAAPMKSATVTPPAKALLTPPAAAAAASAERIALPAL